MDGKGVRPDPHEPPDQARTFWDENPSRERVIHVCRTPWYRFREGRSNGLVF